MAVDPITGLMIAKGVGSVASLLSSIGRRRPEFPAYLEKLLRRLAEQRNFEGFLPDKRAYEESIRAQVDEIMAALPVQSEAFEADLASRGIRGAGEAPKYKFEKVYAPISRAAGSTVAQGMLGYAQAYQQGNIAAEQIRQQAADRLVRFHIAKMGMEYEDYLYDLTGRADFFGDLAETAAYLGIHNFQDIVNLFKSKEDEEVEG